jgi:glycosyltransferase involved in cell wall biosynthesis
MSIHVLFDATPCNPGRPSGAGRYVVELLRALFEIDQTDQIEVFGVQANPPVSGDWPENFRYTQIPISRVLGPFALERARRRFVKTRCAGDRIDIVQANLEPIPISEAGPRSILMLYDTMRIDSAYKSRSEGGFRMRARTWLRYKLAKQTDQILTISEFSKQEIERSLGIDPERITVTHLATGVGFAPGRVDNSGLDKLRLEKGRYILFVGEFGRQKNEDGLIRAYKLARDQGLESDIKLVLVGDPEKLSATARTNLKLPNLGEMVRLSGNPGEAELLNLYRGAMMFVLPSLMEGFGLPALEAMACGCPVIVSRAGALPEVVGEAGETVPANDEDALARAIVRLSNEDNERDRMGKAGLIRASEFSYKRAAQGTMELWHRLAGVEARE